jgi:hypothetical protein
MTTYAVIPETLPKLRQPKSDWCYFLIEHLNEFAKLAWYLTVDTALVECVMVRTVARLESTPFDDSDTLLTYNQARDVLIGEAIAVLNLQHGGGDMGETPIETVTLCELPDLPRLAFLLKLVLRMPEGEVAKLLSVPVPSVSELIGFAIFRLSHSLPMSNEVAIANA